MAARRNRPAGNSRSAGLADYAPPGAGVNHEREQAQIAEKLRELRGTIQKYSGELQAVLRPTQMDVARFVRIVRTSITEQPKLCACEPSTLLTAIIHCATLGLEPGTLLGHAYLLPFNNTKRKRYECQLIIGYKGLITLCSRGSGGIYHVSSDVVYANDEFMVSRGMDSSIKHCEAQGDRGELVAAYAYLRIRDVPREDWPFEVMRKREILLACAPQMLGKQISDRGGAWRTHESEMWRKSAVRKLLKYSPLASIDVQRAIGIDEAYEMAKVDDVWQSEVEGRIATQAELPSGAESPHFEMPEDLREPVPAARRAQQGSGDPREEAAMRG